MNMFYFNIIKSCNSNCQFCAAEYEAMYLNKKSNQYISIGQFKEIAFNMKIVKNDKIILNGGEPTLNPDLLSILEFCDDSGFQTVLFTNGRRLSDFEYLKDIINKNLFKITIPLYGHNDELHNKLTRNEKSFRETVSALEYLSELHDKKKFLLEIKILICRGNYKYIKDVAEFIIKHFKFDDLMISGLIPSDVAFKNNQILEKNLHKEVINEFLDYYWKCNSDNRLVLDGIPLCHLNNKNRIIYLMYRKSYHGIKESRPDRNFYIDVDDIENRGISQEIEKWDRPQCTKKECKYRNICRLNTLINKKEFMENWI